MGDGGPSFDAGMGVPAPMKSSHVHGDLELNYVYSGKVRYFLSGRFVELGAGLLTVFWAAMPHQVVAADAGTEFMWAHVPLVTLLRWNLGNTFVRRILGGEVVADAQGPAWDAELTRRWVADVAAGDAVALRTAELEIEARLRRMAFRRQQKGPPRAGDHPPRRQVEQITTYLAEHYRDDITTADVGAAVGLHPNYAMTLFRRECGMSIWQYLIRLRLSHAQRELLRSDKTVLEVALDSGFGSLARFYAAFAKECGVSPSEFRKRR